MGTAGGGAPSTMDVLKPILSQYRASLRMLRAVIEACPAELWDRADERSRFWQIGYHALFYAHFYLSRSESEFVPWEKAIPEYPFLGRLPWPPHAEPRIGEPYPTAMILEYYDWVFDRVPGWVRTADLEAPSGFDWLPFSRLELHFYNIRHVQHHAGQLIERLHRSGIRGMDWIGMDHETA